MAPLIQPGKLTITNLANNADVAATLNCLQVFGGKVSQNTNGTITITSPADGWANNVNLSAPLDCQNSGTSMRLLTGLLAGQLTGENTNITLIGDASLSRRPMGRILNPLAAMGANIAATNNTNWQGKPCQTAPLSITPAPLTGIDYTLPMASAQVKSAILLAGLGAKGTTTVNEPTQSRDHTERLFHYLGLPLNTTPTANGGYSHQLSPLTQPLVAIEEDWIIPGDISSAAFFLIAALLVPDSRFTLQKIGINPTRTGILDVLDDWGAPVKATNIDHCQGEPIADLIMTHRPIDSDVTIDGALIPRLIDELPIIAIGALAGTGTLTVNNANELRHKESDRIELLRQCFHQLGLPFIATHDGFIIKGLGLEQLITHLGGASDTLSSPLPTGHDHRIAMALRILNHAVAPGTQWPIEAPDCIGVSFPNFTDVLKHLSS